MSTTVLMFPGQSSHYPAMIEDALSLAPEAGTALLTRASEVLGRDVRDVYRSANTEALASNHGVQVGVFLCTQIHLLALHERGVRAVHSLGHSLGEYSHLVHIGAFDFESALQLVDARGRLYDEGPSGVMAALMSVSPEQAQSVISRKGGEVWMAAINAPTQCVVAGRSEDVSAVADLIEDELFAAVHYIEKRIPMHVPRFAPVADKLRVPLAAAPWHSPVLPYLPNVLGKVLPNPTATQIIDLLCRHVHEPVCWRASIEHVLEHVPDASFLEVGPRSVLHNLLQRTWVSAPRDTSTSLLASP